MLISWCKKSWLWSHWYTLLHMLTIYYVLMFPFCFYHLTWAFYFLFCNAFSFSENRPVAMKIDCWNSMLPGFGLNRCRQPVALPRFCMQMKGHLFIFLTFIVCIWAVSGKVSAALLENGLKSILGFFSLKLFPLPLK